MGSNFAQRLGSFWRTLGSLLGRLFGAPVRSRRPGMGAVPFDGGVTFRVWAPNAQRVFVAGTFSGWAPAVHPLARDADGYWSADIAAARPGDRYKFRIINGKQELWRNDPYARAVTNSAGEGIIHDGSFDWPPTAYRTPPWNELTIYELHIGTFSQAENGGRGTLDSAITKLPYLRDLGVNAVLVMPVAEFAGDISWGYNPAHPFAVESSYGGPLALKRFVAAAHDQGIAVILDVVYNHFGPSDLDLWQFDGWSQNSLGGIYFYNDWRAKTPWGDSRPDYGRGEVRQYLRDNALMWLEEYRVDGLRFDMTAFIRNVNGGEHPGDALPDGWSLLRWINDEINSRAPWKLTIAEDLQNNPAVTAHTDEGGMGFDSQWDAAFVHPIRHAIITPDDAQRNMQAVAAAISQRYNGDALRRVIYTESHDEVANGKSRVPEEIKPGDAASWWSKKRSTLGAALVFTAPGIPMIFQGQELLEDGWFQDQEPLDWSRLETQAGIFRLYRDLFRLRRNWENLTPGLLGQHLNIFHVNQSAKVLAFERCHDNPTHSTIVVINMYREPYRNYYIGLPAAGLWQLRFNSDSKEYDPGFGGVGSPQIEARAEPQDGLPFRAGLDIGPYSAVVYSQDRQD